MKDLKFETEISALMVDIWRAFRNGVITKEETIQMMGRLLHLV